MRGAAPLAIGLAVSALLAVADGWAADPARPGAAVLDTIAPTVPRGFAADLPRSPLADAFVNGGLRFASAAEAQRRCPHDEVVRVETFATAYRPAGAAGEGAFMCKAAALQEGDLPR